MAKKSTSAAETSKNPLTATGPTSAANLQLGGPKELLEGVEEEILETELPSASIGNPEALPLEEKEMLEKELLQELENLLKKERSAKYVISINQFAEFSTASAAKKRSIIKQQKAPDTLKLAYYQMAKARIRKSLQNKGNAEPVLQGIDALLKRTPANKRQKNDRLVSLEAMKRFLQLPFPAALRDLDYELLKPTGSKSLLLEGVQISISPDIIFKIHHEGQVHYAAIKIHVAKSCFNRQQQKYVATALQYYLQSVIADRNELVLPELCFSVDVFGEGFVCAPDDPTHYLEEMKRICSEVKELWQIVEDH